VPTIFTRIIEGELPGRFVWRDPDVVAFLSINPLRHGHALVVPRAEVDHWLDLDVGIAERCTAVAHAIGRAQQQAFGAARVGLVIAGFEVPHAHVHVFPADTMGDFDFAHAAQAPDPAGLDAAADAIRRELTALGHPEASA
jgi:diadenosine tetraphosphate (Ap4A) HIT family hydrolase